MKNYEIYKLNNEYPYIVFSTSYINPLEDIEKIEEEMESEFRGKVLFDLLLSNGLTSNRFLEAEFDGGKFQYTSIKPVGNLDNLIKKESITFYRENIDLLQNSVLPNAHKFLIKKGLLV
ncbi:type II toxin-antitoxin system RnlB family antitoxin [Halalkalibacterium halodurans]|uniref:type II toxin-antitoxin system RnlB family antitoxin n=1 Tax=Halalkalibacterium halodurans TaxID=86665 RepID=UPI001ABA8D9C|nr:type II toxin-antitoxin system RnlB family antitoxin [Halalkalibacterium halodurans]